MVDVELLGEFAMIVLRDCEAWQICIAGDAGQHRSGGECFRKAVDQLKGTDQLFVLEKCYRTSFNELSKLNAASVTVVSDPTQDSRRRCSQENDVWHALKEVIQTEGANVQYIAWQNVHIQKINDLVQSRVHGKNVVSSR
jgi:hypothetical protein